MERLTLEQYREMVEDIINFKKLKGQMPDFAIVEGYKIEKKDYIHMIERVNEFVLEIGRNPRAVDIETSNEGEIGPKASATFLK
ncbi:MAG: pseudomurein-binding protein [Euryarchaeota archaeon]|nr:pseudomurein-binding protein [Euryarchaeota archaeon]